MTIFNIFTIRLFDTLDVYVHVRYVRAICFNVWLHDIAGNDIGIQGNLDPAILHGDHATIKVSVGDLTGDRTQTLDEPEYGIEGVLPSFPLHPRPTFSADTCTAQRNV